MGDPINKTVETHDGWGAYWRRDVSRTADCETAGVWADGPLWGGGGLGGVTGRAWVGLGFVGAGVGLVVISVDAMLNAGTSPGVVGVAAVLSWGPWMLAYLGAIHALRAVELRCRPTQSETEFLSQAGGSDIALTLSVRAALAALYGLRPDRIRAADTGRGLTWWMESPLRVEFCEIFLREWGCGMSPETLAARLGNVAPSETVAELVSRVASAVRVAP